MGQEYEYAPPQYYEQQEGGQQPEQHKEGAARKMWSDVSNGARGLFRKVERGVQKIPTEPIKRNAESIGGSVQRVGQAQMRQYQTPDGHVDGMQVAKDVAPYFIPGLGPAKVIMGVTGMGGGGSILRNMGVGVVQDQINVRRAERQQQQANEQHDVIRYQNRDPGAYVQDGQPNTGSQQRYAESYPQQRDLQRDSHVNTQPRVDIAQQVAGLLGHRNALPMALIQQVQQQRRYESVHPPEPVARQVMPQETVRHVMPLGGSSSIDYSTMRAVVPHNNTAMTDTTLPIQRKSTVSTKLGSLGIH